MKFRLPTLAGIVLIFGYFIRESFVMPSSLDPTQVVMVGNDTLGRDWGAMADARDRAKAAMLNGEPAAGQQAQTQQQQSLLPGLGLPLTNPDNLLENEDPYAKQKLNSS